MSENMKWEPVTGGTSYMKVGELPNNEFIGEYSKSVETQFGKTHLFNTNNGLVGINGCGALDYRLTEVNSGEIIKIVYKGKKNGEGKMKGKTFHDLDVLRAVS